jgi:hypothetical protein
MDSHRKKKRNREQAAERYRHAANLALDHLRWCITYLQGVHRGHIARGLAKNRGDHRAVSTGPLAAGNGY